MSLFSFVGALETGLIYSLVALGLFVSYRILNIADLTVEGSFTMGAAISGIFAFSGHPILGIIFAIVGGMFAGFTTGILNTKFKIQSILAGILTMTALYSINIKIMGNKPNVSLVGSNGNVPIKKIFGNFTYNILNVDISKLIIILPIIIFVAIFLILFFKTTLGLSIRATGDNSDMVSSSSINPNKMIIIGLGIANGLVALSGGILAQYQGFADSSMGIGIVVIGLASLIIGESIFKNRRISFHVIIVIVGAIIYRILIALAYKFLPSPSDLKLISAIVVIISISAKNWKEYFSFLKKKRGW